MMLGRLVQKCVDDRLWGRLIGPVEGALVINGVWYRVQEPVWLRVSSAQAVRTNLTDYVMNQRSGCAIPENHLVTRVKLHYRLVPRTHLFNLKWHQLYDTAVTRDADNQVLRQITSILNGSIFPQLRYRLQKAAA